MKLVLTTDEIKKVLCKFASVKATKLHGAKVEIVDSDITFIANEPDYEGDSFSLEAVVETGEVEE